MDDPMEYLHQLAEAARQEQRPQGHVLPAAMLRLRCVLAPPLMGPWSVFAAGAVACAAIAACSVVACYAGTASDPILALYKVASINL